MHQAERARRRLTIGIRARLLDKLNIVDENLAADDDDPALKRTEPALRPEGGATKLFAPGFAHNLLKKLNSDERIQGIPRISNPPPAGFLRSPDAPLRRPAESKSKAGRARSCLARIQAAADGPRARPVWREASTSPGRQPLCRTPGFLILLHSNV